MDGSQFVGLALWGTGISLAKRSRRLSLRQILAAIAAVIVLIGLGIYGRYYWTIGRFLVSTDDATVAADSVIISPKVSGYLSEVLVDDNQAVHAGRTLARIDDRDYRTALAGAQANVTSAQAAIDDLEQKITQQRLSIVQAQAAVSTDQAALAFSQQQFGRYSGLARTGAATVQDSGTTADRSARKGGSAVTRYSGSWRRPEADRRIRRRTRPGHGRTCAAAVAAASG